MRFEFVLALRAVSDPSIDGEGPPPAVGRLVLLGHPVAHSLSPRFQNAALRAAGLPQAYEAVDVPRDGLDDVLRTLAAVRGAGNVTVPHKEAVARRCARLTPTAVRAGAVNTFWYDRARRLVGDNTDVGGFDAAARALVDPTARPARVALVGAGGSAAAVLAAVAGWPGARVRVWSRTPARAESLALRTAAAATPVERLAEALDGATLVVNATPLGLGDLDPLPVGVAEVPPGAAAMDLAYAPARTRWVRLLRAAGVRAEDGLPMLVEQGALAFRRWFGVVADQAAMWGALADVLRAREGA
jgi:shikimate dehydrogenase